MKLRWIEPEIQTVVIPYQNCYNVVSKGTTISDGRSIRHLVFLFVCFFAKIDLKLVKIQL